jgi:hypothetical protein
VTQNCRLSAFRSRGEFAIIFGDQIWRSCAVMKHHRNGRFFGGFGLINEDNVCMKSEFCELFNDFRCDYCEKKLFQQQI